MIYDKIKWFLRMWDSSSRGKLVTGNWLHRRVRYGPMTSHFPFCAGVSKRTNIVICAWINTLLYTCILVHKSLLIFIYYMKNVVSFKFKWSKPWICIAVVYKCCLVYLKYILSIKLFSSELTWCCSSFLYMIIISNFWQAYCRSQKAVTTFHGYLLIIDSTFQRKRWNQLFLKDQLKYLIYRKW